MVACPWGSVGAQRPGQVGRELVALLALAGEPAAWAGALQVSARASSIIRRSSGGSTASSSYCSSRPPDTSRHQAAQSRPSPPSARLRDRGLSFSERLGSRPPDRMSEGPRDLAWFR